MAVTLSASNQILKRLAGRFFILPIIEPIVTDSDWVKRCGTDYALSGRFSGTAITALCQSSGMYCLGLLELGTGENYL